MRAVRRVRERRRGQSSGVHGVTDHERKKGRKLHPAAGQRWDRMVPLEPPSLGTLFRLTAVLIGSLCIALVAHTSGSCKIRREGVSLKWCVE